MMNMICATTKVRNRRIPIIATEPGERNLLAEFAITELRRLLAASRIFFDVTFFALILGGIIQSIILKNIS
jgi:hypothetical protein